MAWCKLEDSARHHFKFNRLAETLKIRRAEARGLFLGLCSWATVSAPDGILIGFTHRDIEDGADWQGRRGTLVPAMIEVGLIDEGAAGILEIHDFFERAESRKLALKKRAGRDRTATVPGQSQDCPDERRGEREEKEKEKRERGEDPRAPKEFLDLSGPHRSTKMVEPYVLAKHRELMLKHGRQPPENYDAADAASGGRLYGKYPTQWEDVLGAFIAEQRYQFCGWSLAWIAKNAAEVAGKYLTKTPTDDDPEPNPTSDDWEPWFRRQQARKA